MKKILAIILLFWMWHTPGFADSKKKDDVFKQFQITDISPSKLDFSNSVTPNEALIDLRKTDVFEKDDAYFLNILMHNLKDAKIISFQDFKRILQYKRKKVENIEGVKLICGGDPNFVDDSPYLIGIEFQNLTNLIGYGFEDDLWFDFNGTYKRTSSDIELDIKAIDSNEKNTGKINRKTLKIGSDQCSILNPSINMNRIIKNVYLNILEKSTNKL